MIFLLWIVQFVAYGLVYLFPFYTIGVPTIVWIIVCAIALLFDTLCGIVNFIGWVISLFVILNTPFSWFTVVYFAVFALYLCISLVPGIMNAVYLHRSQKG